MNRDGLLMGLSQVKTILSNRLGQETHVPPQPEGDGYWVAHKRMLDMLTGLVERISAMQGSLKETNDMGDELAAAIIPYRRVSSFAVLTALQQPDLNLEHQLNKLARARMFAPPGLELNPKSPPVSHQQSLDDLSALDQKVRVISELTQLLTYLSSLTVLDQSYREEMGIT